MGGIDIDGHGRVKRPDGSAIAGLYAAGGATGGLEGGGALGYVGGLIKACVFGLRVAEHAIGQLRREADVLK
jgi:fumarate reductase flavoprotein subunit